MGSEMCIRDRDYMTGMEKYHETEEGYSYFIVKIQPCLILEKMEKMEDENV